MWVIRILEQQAIFTQGVTLECFGQACREQEQFLTDQGRDWYELLTTYLRYEKKLKTKYGIKDGEESSEQPFFNVTRLDLAFDERYSEQGNYALMSLYAHLEVGAYKLLAKTNIGLAWVEIWCTEGK